MVNSYSRYGVGVVFLGFSERSESVIFIVEVLLRDKKKNPTVSTTIRNNKTVIFFGIGSIVTYLFLELLHYIITQRHYSYGKIYLFFERKKINECILLPR